MKPATTLALVALATTLGGCKSFVQAFDFSRHSSAPQYAIGPGDLEEGRAFLDAGAYGNALAPLHRAALHPQTSGEALNALGVAYARLGRADLAERFFIAATRVDAGNERYAANLGRFYHSELAADTRLLYAQQQQAGEALQKFAQSQAALPAEPLVDRRVVTSGGEARTITVSRPVPSTRISLGKDPAQQDAVVAARPRVQLSGGSAVQPRPSARPAEIRIGSKVTSGAVTARQASAYPLRVKLTPPAANSGKD